MSDIYFTYTITLHCLVARTRWFLESDLTGRKALPCNTTCCKTGCSWKAARASSNQGRIFPETLLAAVTGRAGSSWWHLKGELINSQPSPEPFDKAATPSWQRRCRQSCSPHSNSHQSREVCGCSMNPPQTVIIPSRSCSPTTALHISACRVFSICSTGNAKIQEKEAKAEHQVVKAIPSSTRFLILPSSSARTVGSHFTL